MLSIFFTSQLFSQNPSGISINWDVSTGCQTYSQEIRDGKDPIFIENIAEGQCITVCENTQVTYTLTGAFATNPNTTWSVTGGTINSQTNSNCLITWGSQGSGQLTFTTTSTTGVITKTICFDKVIKPSVLFNIEPIELGKALVGCSNQIIYFNNLSTTNGGSGLNSYYWDFGDNTTSTAFEPSHIYTADAEYSIKLTVTNSCGCSSTFTKKITIGKIGFDIICPSVVCNGQTAQYSLPPLAIARCTGNYNWSVVGGTATVLNESVLNVVWNNVDTSGFGYVTFNPSACGLTCAEPTTIRIPVIQSVGTIIGNNTMCLGSQERYVLPQWPATTFTWEIQGNIDNSLAEVIPTNQRNEVIINPLVSGILKLKATYYNTLLHCGGTAIFTINVTNVLEIYGPDTVCQNTLGYYTIATDESTSWTLKDSTGTTITTVANSSTFNYLFSTSGTYTLSIGGSTGCPSGDKTIVVVPVSGAPTIVNPKIIVCPNAPYTYTIAGTNANAQYVWQVTGGTFVGATTGNSVTIIYDNSATHVLSVYNQSVNPIVCNSPTTTLNINRQPINASISSLNGIVCANNYSNYSAIITGSSPEVAYEEGDTYTWTISNPVMGSITAGQGTKNITVLWNNVNFDTNATNNPILSLVIKKCTVTSAPINKTITLRPIPTILVTPSNTSVCSGVANTLNFTVSAAAGFSINADAVVSWTINGIPTTASTGLTMTGISFTNVSGVANNQYVTATIVTPNGCTGTTNTATKVITVNPEPTATASNITTGGINTFCTAAQINATLKAGTFTGATIVWQKSTDGVNFTAITPAQTGVNIIIGNNASTGFGFYRFIATRLGCSSISNIIQIRQSCLDPIICTISPTPTVTNVSTKGCITAPPVNTGCATCGTINLIGTASGTPLSRQWLVNGPINFTANNTNTASIPNPVVGVYNTYFKANYTCTSGQVGAVQAYKEIVIAYLPDFDFKPLCSNNATFSLGVTDKTSFLGGVTSKVFKYTYKLATATTWQPLITVANGTTTSLATGLTAGNYQVKLIVTGSYGGVAQQACEKVYSFTLAGVPALNLQVGEILCHDTAVQFNIGGLTNITDTFLWNFNDGATNTLKDPKHVFLTSGTKNVSVTITNKYNCSVTLTSTNFIIPPKCFNGTVNSNPNPASVCDGNSVTLSYLPTIGECPVVNYVWMNGNEPIQTTPPNASTINVTAEGFYWVKVSKTNGVCAYDTPNRITPTFKPLPTLDFPAIASVCSNTAITASITTNATTISWKINSDVQPQFANLASISIPAGFVAGTYVFEVTATSIGGCSRTATQILIVATTPSTPIITQTLLTCSPYKVKLTATGTSGNYNWSNGENAIETIVNEGGPYSLTVSSGGCKVVTQIDVPRSPESLLWVFPTGCYTTCSDNVGALIGPNQPIREWEWLQNDAVIGTGFNEVVTPLPLNQSGIYNLAITTANSCTSTSGNLNYTITPCERCEIITQINEVLVTNNPFCSYTLNLSIVNNSGNPLAVTFTNPSNDVVITPAGVTLNAGPNTILLTIVPIGGFTGGLLNLNINGFNVKDNTRCDFPLTLTLPNCDGSGGNNKSALIKSNLNNDVSLVIAPNPTKESTTINFNSNTTKPTLEVYTLLGNKISGYTASSSKGSWNLVTSALPSGIYIVVMKENNSVVKQQKLIKN